MTSSDGAPSAILRLRYRPGSPGDGVLEREHADPIPVPAPDWDKALELLLRMNALQDSRGRRLSSLLIVDGFEPWWYGQDRLLRFLLVPLTQYLPLLEAAAEYKSLEIADAPADLRRLGAAIGKPFPFRSVKTGFSIGRHLLQDLSTMALLAFRLGRRDTVLYIVDHVSPGLREDFRFSPLYRELERREYRFAEYAHTLSPRQAIRNLFRRRRPVFFLEAADEMARPFRKRESLRVEPPTAPMDLETRALWALVPSVLAGCADSAARQILLKQVLKMQGARRAIIFDDNRHNHELVAACRTLGIPVLGFQHGVFNKFHAGSMAFGFEGKPHAFDRYGVWSELFRQRLLQDSRLYAGESVFVSGPVRPPEGNLPAAKSPRAGGSIRVLIVSEPLARKAEVAPYLRALQADARFELCIKLRPGEPAAGIADYGLTAESVRLLQTGTVYDAFEQVDVVVGTYSSVLYEAALALLPTVWLRTTRAYGRELTEEGLADAAESPASVADTVARAAAQSGPERIRRRELVWGKDPGQGAVRLLDEAERTLWLK